jgi:uncharacterized membrane protein
MERKLRGVDIVGLFFASLCVFEAIVGLMLQPTYLKMFRDFSTSLPPLTRIMLNPATLLIGGLIPMALMAEGVLRQRSEGSQLARCVVAMIGSAGLIVGFVAAIYLPMIGLAAEIH